MFKDISFNDIEIITNSSKKMMPNASNLVYQMSVDYAYRNGLKLQQVLDIQR